MTDLSSDFSPFLHPKMIDNLMVGGREGVGWVVGVGRNVVESSMVKRLADGMPFLRPTDR